MVSVQEAKELIMSLLESNIQDPLNRNKKWIYDDIPRLDLSSYPRIGIEATNSTIEWLRVGGGEQINQAIIHIYIYVKKRQKATINDILYRDNQLLDYLADEVIRTIKSNQDYFWQNDIIQAKPIGEDFHFTEDILIKDISVKVLFVR